MMNNNKTSPVRSMAIAISYVLWGMQIIGLILYSIYVAFHHSGKSFLPNGVNFLCGSLLVVTFILAIWTLVARWVFKIVLIANGRVEVNSNLAWLLFVIFGIAIWVPSGAISIFGLVLFMNTDSYFWYMLFSVLSALLLVLNAPRALTPKAIHSDGN